MIFSCLQAEFRPVLSWHRTVKKCHLPGAEASLGQRTPQILQGDTVWSSNLVLNLPCSRKSQTEKLRALRVGFVFQVKKTPKLQKGSDEISEFCLVLIQNLPGTWVTPNLSQVHQELSWFPVSLAMFCTALQESQLNPEGIPCEAQGITLLHSAFFRTLPKQLPNWGTSEHWKHFNYLRVHTQ